MTEARANLDVAIDEKKASSRIELSLPVREIAKHISDETNATVDLRPFYRQGLGEWIGFVFDSEDVGDFIFAGPATKSRAGCSVWFDNRDDLDQSTVATLIKSLVGKENLIFLDPDTGEAVLPLEAEVLDFSQNDQRRAQAERTVRIRRSRAVGGTKIEEFEYGSDEVATLGERISVARERAGLSKAELAEILSVQQATLTSWENDAVEPRSSRATILAGILGVSTSWLLSGIGEGVPAPDEDEALDDDALTERLLVELREAQGMQQRIARRMARIEDALVALKCA